MKKIGAQRLYKAVKNGDVSMTILFLTSENKGPFQYQKAYNAWIEGGKEIPILDALLQYEPLRKWSKGSYRRIRRGKKHFDNDDFIILPKVLELMADSIQAYTSGPNEPSTQTLLWLKELTEVLVSYEGDIPLNTNSFASILRNAVQQDKEWPWPIAAVSRGLGIDLATFDYKETSQRKAAIDWFLDMHGMVTAQDFEVYTDNFARFMEGQRYDELQQLIPDAELIKQLLNKDDYRFRNEVKHLVNSHKQYLKLLKIAPWIATVGDKDED